MRTALQTQDKTGSIPLEVLQAGALTQHIAPLAKGTAELLARAARGKRNLKQQFPNRNLLRNKILSRHDLEDLEELRDISCLNLSWAYELGDLITILDAESALEYSIEQLREAMDSFERILYDPLKVLIPHHIEKSKHSRSNIAGISSSLGVPASIIQNVAYEGVAEGWLRRRRNGRAAYLDSPLENQLAIAGVIQYFVDDDKKNLLAVADTVDFVLIYLGSNPGGSGLFSYLSNQSAPVLRDGDMASSLLTRLNWIGVVDPTTKGWIPGRYFPSSMIKTKETRGVDSSLDDFN